MKKPNFDTKKRPYTHNRFMQNNRHESTPVVDNFSKDKLEQFSGELVELFKLIQAVRYDRISLQEEYNEYRNKLSNDRMELETEVIKIKKQYNARISALQEEYNSVKSNNSIELAKVREG